MKKISYFLVPLGSLAALFYLTGAFINAGFNISGWSEDSRGIIGSFYLLLAVISIIVLVVIDNEKANKG